VYLLIINGCYVVQGSTFFKPAYVENDPFCLTG
jgi:hypothetical protein